MEIILLFVMTLFLNMVQSICIVILEAFYTKLLSSI